MEAALRYVDRVPAKERLLFQAWKAHLDGRDEDANVLYARAAEAYPQDKEVLFWPAISTCTRATRRRALPYFERAVALDPTWEPALMHLTDASPPWAGRSELAAGARDWVEKAPSAAAYWALCLPSCWRGGGGGAWTPRAAPSSSTARPTPGSSPRRW